MIAGSCGACGAVDWHRVRRGRGDVAHLLACRRARRSAIRRRANRKIAHEGVQRQDIVVGVIGSVDTGLDSDVLNAFNKAGLKAPYVSTSMVDDPDAAAQRGVRSMVTRKATVIMIDDIAVNEKNAEDWDAALQSARKAGVPVILLDPVAPPDDDTLFAVTFTLTGKGDGVTALDDAVVTIVDDKPHPRTMNVTDNLS